MALTWRPDTCKCVIMLDGTTAASVLQRCTAHSAGESAAVIHAENQRKNRAIAALVEHATDLSPEQIAWRFDTDRALILSAPSLGVRKTAAQTALDVRLGPGTVTVE